MIAPDTDLSGALTLAESLRESINSAPFSTEWGSHPVSVSIGVSLCASNVTCTLDDVISEADAALYTAKNTGRNKVVCSGECGHVEVLTN